MEDREFDKSTRRRRQLQRAQNAENVRDESSRRSAAERPAGPDAGPGSARQEETRAGLDRGHGFSVFNLVNEDDGNGGESELLEQRIGRPLRFALQPPLRLEPGDWERKPARAPKQEADVIVISDDEGAAAAPAPGPAAGAGPSNQLRLRPQGTAVDGDGAAAGSAAGPVGDAPPAEAGGVRGPGLTPRRAARVRREHGPAAAPVANAVAAAVAVAAAAAGAAHGGDGADAAGVGGAAAAAATSLGAPAAAQGARPTTSTRTTAAGGAISAGEAAIVAPAAVAVAPAAGPAAAEGAAAAAGRDVGAGGSVAGQVAAGGSGGVAAAAAGPAGRQLTCGICLDEQPAQAFHTIEACRHQYCRGCLAQHVRLAAREKVFPVRCPQPDCRATGVSVAEGLALLDTAEDREKLTMLEVESSLPQHLRFYCPNPACSLLMILDEDEPPENAPVRCHGCRKQLCPRCRVVWHTGLSCAQHRAVAAQRDGGADAALLNVAGERGWKPCPQCRNLVELAHGCNHITCKCGAEWCYKCGAPWRRTQPPGGAAGPAAGFLRGRSMPTCSCRLWDDNNRRLEQEYRARWYARNGIPADVARRRAVDELVDMGILQNNGNGNGQPNNGNHQPNNTFGQAAAAALAAAERLREALRLPGPGPAGRMPAEREPAAGGAAGQANGAGASGGANRLERIGGEPAAAADGVGGAAGRAVPIVFGALPDAMWRMPPEAGRRAGDAVDVGVGGGRPAAAGPGPGPAAGAAGRRMSRVQMRVQARQEMRAAQAAMRAAIRGRLAPGAANAAAGAAAGGGGAAAAGAGPAESAAQSRPPAPQTPAAEGAAGRADVQGRDDRDGGSIAGRPVPIRGAAAAAAPAMESRAAGPGPGPFAPWAAARDFGGGLGLAARPWGAEPPRGGPAAAAAAPVPDAGARGGGGANAGGRDRQEGRLTPWWSDDDLAAMVEPPEYPFPLFGAQDPERDGDGLDEFLRDPFNPRGREPPRGLGVGLALPLPETMFGFPRAMEEHPWQRPVHPGSPPQARPLPQLPPRPPVPNWRAFDFEAFLGDDPPRTFMRSPPRQPFGQADPAGRAAGAATAAAAGGAAAGGTGGAAAGGSQDAPMSARQTLLNSELGGRLQRIAADGLATRLRQHEARADVGSAREAVAAARGTAAAQVAAAAAAAPPVAPAAQQQGAGAAATAAARAGVDSGGGKKEEQRAGRREDKEGERGTRRSRLLWAVRPRRGRDTRRLLGDPSGDGSGGTTSSTNSSSDDEADGVRGVGNGKGGDGDKGASQRIDSGSESVPGLRALMSDGDSESESDGGAGPGAGVLGRAVRRQPRRQARDGFGLRRAEAGERGARVVQALGIGGGGGADGAGAGGAAATAQGAGRNVAEQGRDPVARAELVDRDPLRTGQITARSRPVYLPEERTATCTRRAASAAGPAVGGWRMPAPVAARGPAADIWRPLPPPSPPRQRQQPSAATAHSGKRLGMFLFRQVASSYSSSGSSSSEEEGEEHDQEKQRAGEEGAGKAVQGEPQGVGGGGPGRQHQQDGRPGVAAAKAAVRHKKTNRMSCGVIPRRRLVRDARVAGVAGLGRTAAGGRDALPSPPPQQQQAQQQQREEGRQGPDGSVAAAASVAAAETAPAAGVAVTAAKKATAAPSAPALHDPAHWDRVRAEARSRAEAAARAAAEAVRARERGVAGAAAGSGAAAAGRSGAGAAISAAGPTAGGAASKLVRLDVRLAGPAAAGAAAASPALAPAPAAAPAAAAGADAQAQRQKQQRQSLDVLAARGGGRGLRQYMDTEEEEEEELRDWFRTLWGEGPEGQGGPKKRQEQQLQPIRGRRSVVEDTDESGDRPLVARGRLLRQRENPHDDSDDGGAANGQAPDMDPNAAAATTAAARGAAAASGTPPAAPEAAGAAAPAAPWPFAAPLLPPPGPPPAPAAREQKTGAGSVHAAGTGGSRREAPSFRTSFEAALAKMAVPFCDAKDLEPDPRPRRRRRLSGLQDPVLPAGLGSSPRAPQEVTQPVMPPPPAAAQQQQPRDVEPPPRDPGPPPQHMRLSSRTPGHSTAAHPAAQQAAGPSRSLATNLKGEAPEAAADDAPGPAVPAADGGSGAAVNAAAYGAAQRAAAGSTGVGAQTAACRSRDAATGVAAPTTVAVATAAAAMPAGPVAQSSQGSARVGVGGGGGAATGARGSASGEAAARGLRLFTRSPSGSVPVGRGGTQGTAEMASLRLKFESLRSIHENMTKGKGVVRAASGAAAGAQQPAAAPAAAANGQDRAGAGGNVAIAVTTRSAGSASAGAGGAVGAQGVGLAVVTGSGSPKGSAGGRSDETEGFDRLYADEGLALGLALGRRGRADDTPSPPPLKLRRRDEGGAGDVAAARRPGARSGLSLSQLPPLRQAPQRLAPPPSPRREPAMETERGAGPPQAGSDGHSGGGMASGRCRRWDSGDDGAADVPQADGANAAAGGGGAAAPVPGLAAAMDAGQQQQLFRHNSAGASSGGGAGAAGASAARAAAAGAAVAPAVVGAVEADDQQDAVAQASRLAAAADGADPVAAEPPPLALPPAGGVQVLPAHALQLPMDGGDTAAVTAAANAVAAAAAGGAGGQLAAPPPAVVVQVVLQVVHQGNGPLSQATLEQVRQQLDELLAGVRQQQQNYQQHQQQQQADGE